LLVAEMKKEPTKLIPTNVITGFLGVGKTTVIQHLLEQKPENERWAILVNEFGEIGIDNNLFADVSTEKGGITVSQVPGGCMCCANGLPMQMALSLLLVKSKPHRLLIEPTGLGHPKEVLAILSSEYNREVLKLQATLTLVDSRKMQDERYTSNATFTQQLEIAEVIIANKADLYGPRDFPALLDYIDESFGLDSKLVYQVQHGAVALEWLTQPTNTNNYAEYQKHSIPEQPTALPPPLEAPEQGFVRADNSGEGFFSRGWIFSAKCQFNCENLHSLIVGVQAERLKGVFSTEEGLVSFNKVDSVVTKIALNSSAEDICDSRLELISNRLDSFDGIEEALLGCLEKQDVGSRIERQL
tara:strand:- start:118 stop:1188 length:1071 start_codon:yes stop_codon:yes gene_type:complete